MSETDFEFPEFATAYSKAARKMRDELPDDARQALIQVVDELAADPERFSQHTTASEKNADEFIYQHPPSKLELTYRIDRAGKRIYFLHVAAPKLDVAKPLFVSYAHEDKKWLDHLRKWLKPLEKKDLIKIWDDRDIKGGDKWQEEIEASLTVAKAALLLVSQDFIASDFISDEELPKLLDAADKRGVKIFWVAVDVSTVEDDHPKLAAFQAMNTDPEKPLALLKKKHRSREFKEIYKKIKKVVER
jgi:hypothetical protein